MPFPLFDSHLDLAHNYWKALLSPSDWAIDATCGNGHDTLLLSEALSQGGVISIDIDKRATERTAGRLGSPIPPHVHLFTQSHENFPEIASQYPIRLIIYNLGYLPGAGTKEHTTKTESTLKSIHQALSLIRPGGVISITCYPGHPEGAIEEKALHSLVRTLSPHEWSVFNHARLNRPASPSLLLLQKNNLQKN